MVAGIAAAGLWFDPKSAAAIYVLYSAAVYLAALPGVCLADRVFGQQNAIWYGGIIIAAGQIVLSLPGFTGGPELYGCYFGLMLIVLGTGLLKPNISSCMGARYPEGGACRGAGYDIYYLSLNTD